MSDDKMVEVDLYDSQKGLLKRDGGPYLDDVEKVKAEEWRAKVEGREPDLDNPPSTVATYLVPKSVLTETDASHGHISAAAELENDPVTTVMVDTSGNRDLPPDPLQAGWDNDAQKVTALQANKELGSSQLSSKKYSSSSTPKESKQSAGS